MKNPIIVQKADFDFGLRIDDSFRLMLDGEEIGKGGISKTNNPLEIYLEWIELYPKFRGKHLFRSVLLAISEYYKIEKYVFESSIDNVDKYIYLGASKGEYDEFREMQSFNLSIKNI